MPVDNRKKKFNIDKILDETPPKDTPEPVIDLDAEPTTEPVVTPDVEPTPEVVVEEPEDVSTTVEPGSEPEPEEKTVDKPVDYKEKFSESSREAMSLHFKNEKLNSLLSGDLEVSDPTEEELRAYAKTNDADYDELDTFSKNILRRTLITEKKETKRTQAYDEIKKIDTWAKKVEEFVVSEENIAKYPSLEGQQEDFKRYCMKDTQRGVDFNLLVASFLYENDNIPERKNKGSLFLSRGNGRATPPVLTGISADEAASIRVNNPKEYRKLIKAGKIRIEV